MAIPRRQTGNEGSGNGEVVELLAKSALQAIRDPNAPLTATKQRRKSRVLVALRTFGLTLFPSLQSEPEQLKIAIQRDRLDACIGCLIHIIPLAGAVALLVLNFSWYYVGTNFNSQGIVALQFAAKLHEMTVIASLSNAFLSYIRYDLTSKTGLPFGAAFAGLRVTQLSYLWSPELWGSLTSKSYSWKFKLRIALAIFFVALLMATVGPASAASMIPRRARWFGENVMLATNTTEDTMFPTHLTLDLYSSSNENCSESIADDSKLPCPWSSDIIGRASILSLVPTLNNMTYYDNLDLNIHPNVSFRTGSWLTFGFPIPFTISLQTDLGSDQSTISVASSVQARGLLQFSTSTLQNSELLYSDSLSVDTDDCMDAYSRVQCFMNHTVIWDISDPEPALSFSARPGQPDITDYITDTERELLSNNARASNGTSVDLIFVDLPDLDTSGVIMVQSAWSESHPDNDDFLVTPCTLELGWFYTELGYNGQIITSQGPPEPGSSKIRRAYADRDWLATTNPFLEDVHMTAMNFLSYGVENLGSSQAPSIISTLTAVTLSAMSPTSVPFGIIGNDSRISLPTFGWQEYDLKDMKNFPLKFPQRIYQSGYGYGPNVLAVKISLAILIFYCLVAVAHIVYSIVTGTTSTAWDSISEIVALALNSRPAPELQYTCAGIQTTHVFEHNVRIASTTGILDSKTEVQRDAENLASEPVGRHLELLFPSQDGHAVSTVMANAKYGTFKEKLD